LSNPTAAQENKFSSEMQRFIATSRGRSYTIVIITALLILVLIFLAILPAVNAIILQVNQNGDRLQALARIDEKREALRTLLSKHQENLSLAVGLAHALPYELDQEALINDIVAYGTANQVFLRSIRFVDISGRSRLEEIFADEPDVELIDGAIINVAMEGDRDRLRQFISTLEASRRIFSIKTISLSQVGQGESSTNSPYVMNVQIETYFWNQTKLSE
jgi:Tfp pilus assembly protein PilO